MVLYILRLVLRAIGVKGRPRYLRRPFIATVMVLSLGFGIAILQLPRVPKIVVKRLLFAPRGAVVMVSIVIKVGRA